ncbi:MFS transporter [Caulobacter sp. KR2-114]|uniref:MFS transporter n=1 Tax=Caulobacter sp. KR2-114 TaxID=3400912 RepID=UPI003C0C4D45
MHNDTEAVGARIDALAGSWRLWRWILAIAVGGFFEIYDLTLTAPLSAGLVNAGVFRTGHAGLFGLADQATFIAATFLGLYLGVIGFSAFGDRLGRRRVFAYSLIWYAAATLVMGLQSEVVSLCFWRFVAGIGVGAEAVAIDCFVVEITPARLRGRAFSLSMAVQYLAIPTAAFLAAWLIPLAPAGVAGWRWMTLAPALGAAGFWFARRSLPESPRWLAARGRAEEAHRILDGLPAQRRHPGEVTATPAAPVTTTPATRRYLVRATIMMLVYFNLQNVAYFGFSNWLPTLLQAQGAPLKNSLLYSAGVSLAAPLSPLLLLLLADRFERKHLLIVAGLVSVACGLAFAGARSPMGWITFGLGLAVANTILSVSSHNYLSELYPTEIRARAAGFVYSFTRLAAAVSGYIIAAILDAGGPGQVFVAISGFMIAALAAVAFAGPRTRHRTVELPATAP